MEQKQQFNTLPRPTFRWLRCNHMDTTLRSVEPVESTISLSGDVDTVTTLVDTERMNDEYTGANEEALLAVSERFLTGLEINVPAGEKKTLVLHSHVTEANPAESLRIRINAEPDSELTLSLLMEGEGNIASSYQIFTEVNGEDNSKVTLKKVQLLPTTCQQVEHRYANLAEAAEVHYLNVELGGDENIYHYVTEMAGKKSNMDHDFAYLGDGTQRFDISMLMSHSGKKSNCDVHVLGALTGEARKAFRGTLDFLRGCTGSEGAEEDTCLLLNDSVKSISLPLLLCKEDNVVGNHAASAGQIDPNRLFYLMSRGFSEAEAKVMLVESMLRPILDRVGEAAIEEKALTFIREKVHA